MRLKSTVLIIGILVFGSLGLKRIATSSQEEDKWEERNTIRAIARRNKAKENRRIVIPGPTIDYPGMNSTVEDLLQNYSLVVAEPIASHSYLVNPSNIATWYKFRTCETLSLKTPQYCNTCPQQTNPPQELGPVLSNEFLLAVDGGTLFVEGLEVSEKSNSIPAFEKGTKYLLFISFLPGGVARLAAGPAAIFRVGDNDKLNGVDVKKHRAYDEVNVRFNGKLSILKAQINR